MMTTPQKVATLFISDSMMTNVRSFDKLDSTRDSGLAVTPTDTAMTTVKAKKHEALPRTAKRKATTTTTEG